MADPRCISFKEPKTPAQAERLDLTGVDRAPMRTIGLAIGPIGPVGPWARANLAHLVGGGLVAVLLLAYCLVLEASTRQADQARAAETAILQARMDCERLPLARARSACSQGALRGDIAAPAP